MKSGLFEPWDLNLVSTNFPRISSDSLFTDLQIIKGIKLLGFKDHSELRFEDNIKHSQFIYPDELVSIDTRLLYSYWLDLSLVVLGQQTNFQRTSSIYD